MLKVATHSARRAKLHGRAAGNHCIVLENLEIVDVDAECANGQLQISSAGVSTAVNRMARHEDEMDAAGI
jgi:hypothetical protein